MERLLNRITLCNWTGSPRVTEPYHLTLLDSFTGNTERYWTVLPGISERSLVGTKSSHYVATLFGSCTDLNSYKSVPNTTLFYLTYRAVQHAMIKSLI